MPIKNKNKKEGAKHHANSHPGTVCGHRSSSCCPRKVILNYASFAIAV